MNRLKEVDDFLSGLDKERGSNTLRRVHQPTGFSVEITVYRLTESRTMRIDMPDDLAPILKSALRESYYIW
jgi:hypothetical protein